MKKIVLGLLLATTLLLGGCEQTETEVSTLTKVLDQGYIVMGLDDTFAPMGFRDEDGEIVGFDVELAQAVASALGVELRLQPIDWDAKVLELNSGNIDMIWNGLTITEERLEQMTFSDPYLNNRQIVLTSSDTTITSLDDLAGLSIGVQIDSSGQSALEDNTIYTDIEEMVQFNTFTEALLDLESGRIDAIVIDEIMGRYVVSQNTYSVIVTDVSLGDEEYGIGFRLADTSLRDEIDSILTSLQADGTTATISTTWFGEDIFIR